MQTIHKLIHSIELRSNQSKLARALNVNRGTLRKLMTDIEGEYHEIRNHNGKWQLMVLNPLAKRALKLVSQ